jgi:hypothetical protein
MLQQPNAVAIDWQAGKTKRQRSRGMQRCRLCRWLLSLQGTEPGGPRERRRVPATAGCIG